MQHIPLSDTPTFEPGLALIFAGAALVIVGVAMHMASRGKEHTSSLRFPVSTWALGLISVLVGVGALVASGYGGGHVEPDLGAVEAAGYEIRGEATNEEGEPLPDQNSYPADGGTSVPLRHTETGNTCLGVTVSRNSQLQLVVACYGN